MTNDPDVHKSGRGGITDAAADSAADVGKSLIKGITPADQGWVLGFIIVVAIIVLSDMWVSLKTLQANAERHEYTQNYFEMVEVHRADQFEQSLEQFTDASRRYQEVIRALTETVARDSERAGAAALSVIDETSRRQLIEETTRPNPEFIGPQEE